MTPHIEEIDRGMPRVTSGEFGADWFSFSDLKQITLRVCAWCKKSHCGGELWISSPSHERNQTYTSVTHGICPVCAGNELAELDKKTEFQPSLHYSGAF